MALIVIIIVTTATKAD